MKEIEESSDNRAAVPVYKKPYVWAFTTYFTEGFPFIMIRTVSSVFFRDLKVSLEGIGLTSLYGLPWILKFLWAPQVDSYGTKRKWMLLTQSVLFFIMLISSFFTPLDMGVKVIAGLFFVGAIVAATHDIAIDGYYMEALDKDGQAKYVGYRVMAYRIAMMTGTGVIVTIGATFGWFMGFLSASLIFGCFLVYHLFYLQEVEKQHLSVRKLLKQLFRLKTLFIALFLSLMVFGIRILLSSYWYGELKNMFPLLKKIYFSHYVGIFLLLSLFCLALFAGKIKAYLMRDPDSHYARAFVTFVDRDGMGVVLMFIILLRTGEWMLTTMVSPLMVDLGLKVHYGWISAGVGLPASIVGAMLGGWMISRYTLKKVIWPFILAQNLTNLVYMGLAWYLSDFIVLNTGLAEPHSIGAFNLVLVAGVQGFDQFAGGLGTAVLMTYLMRICLDEFKAAHYAIGSGLMSVTGLFAGVLSGFLAGWLGYAWLFGISFLSSVPAMLIIPFLPRMEERDNVTT